MDVMIVCETGHAADDFDAVAGKLGLGDIDLSLDDVLDAEGKIGHGDLFLHAVIHAVDGAVVVAGEMQDGFAHRFAGDGAGVDADAADDAAHLNERYVLAPLDRGNSGALTGRARTYYQKIVFRHALEGTPERSGPVLILTLCGY